MGLVYCQAAGASFKQAWLDRNRRELRARLGYSAPRILCEDVPITKVFETHEPKADEALLIQIAFSLESRSFACQLVIFMPGASLVPLRASLDDFLKAL